MRKLTALLNGSLLGVAICLLAFAPNAAYAQILAGIMFGSRGGSFTPFDVGVDFRGTCGYVTDPTYAFCEVDPTGLDYPKTATNGAGQSLTYGWESTCWGSYADRSNTVDARLAGIVYWGNTNPTICVFRVDLPATGTYSIGLGIGDQGSFAQSTYILVKDNATTFITFSPATTTGITETDAAGNNWTNAATWVSSNVTVSRVFGSTIFRLYLGNGNVGGSGNSVLQTIRITRTA